MFGLFVIGEVVVLGLEEGGVWKEEVFGGSYCFCFFRRFWFDIR